MFHRSPHSLPAASTGDNGPLSLTPVITFHAARPTPPCTPAGVPARVIQRALVDVGETERPFGCGSDDMQAARDLAIGRVLARRMSVPPPPSVTAVGVLPLPDEPPREHPGARVSTAPTRAVWRSCLGWHV